MIYVRIEMWPGGDYKRPKVLQEGIIANVGGDESKGDYEFQFSRVGGFKCPPENLARFEVKNVLRAGEIKGFPRLKLYAHDLLFRALRIAFGERNQ